MGFKLSPPRSRWAAGLVALGLVAWTTVAVVAPAQASVAVTPTSSNVNVLAGSSYVSLGVGSNVISGLASGDTTTVTVTASLGNVKVSSTSGAATFTITGTQSVVNSALSTLSYQYNTAAVSTVTISESTSAATSVITVTTVNAPTVASLSPVTGPATGGTAVVITGTNLTAATEVTFGGMPAAFNVTSATSITATTPVMPAGAVAVAVTTSGGTVSLNASYLVVAAPTVSAVTPTSVAAGSTQAVTITGTGFTAASTVSFGGTAATGVTVVSTTSITATAPARASGVVNVEVTTEGGTGSLTNAFTYAPVPTVTSVSPTAGGTGGGTSVTITGTGFIDSAVVSSVTFGGVAAASYTVNSSTSITAVTPALASGAKNVVVTTIGGLGTLTGGFTAVTGPTVTSVSASTGPADGGTSVTITGTNFTGVTHVYFGGVLGSFTVNSSTSITARTPAGSAGAVTVSVTAAGGTGAMTSAFTYIAAPVVTNVSPNIGATTGATSVTITGSGFTGATVVTFGGTSATTFTVSSSTSISARTPTGTSGLTTVAVTTRGGTGTLSNGFRYAATPTVTAVTPGSGLPKGGDSVVITGTGFIGASKVTFGSVTASFTTESDTTITAIVPTGSAGVVVVAVTAPGGTGTLTKGYTYEAATSLTTVSPGSGPEAGGTTVTLTGSGFTGASQVTFGGVPAPFTVVSSTSISTRTPAGVAGAANVTVVTPKESVTKESGFTYMSATLSSNQKTAVVKPVFKEVLPGTARLIVSGDKQQIKISPDDLRSLVELTGNGFTVKVAGATPGGFAMGLDSFNTVQLQTNGMVRLSGSGFKPGSTVSVYMLTKPRVLGSFAADSDGTFSGSLLVPLGQSLGSRTLEVNGFTKDGADRSVSLGVNLQSDLPRNVKRTSSTVTFPTGSANLTKKATATLKQLVAEIDPTATEVTIGAYLQDDGSGTGDSTLAIARGESIKAWLTKVGVTGSISVDPYSMYSNSSDESESRVLVAATYA